MKKVVIHIILNIVCGFFFFFTGLFCSLSWATGLCELDLCLTYGVQDQEAKHVV